MIYCAEDIDLNVNIFYKYLSECYKLRIATWLLSICQHLTSEHQN